MENASTILVKLDANGGQTFANLEQVSKLAAGRQQSDMAAKGKGGTVTNEKLILTLKICISVGICLIALGIYLHNFNDTVEAMGVQGIILSAMCVAFGMALSLPTKMYLTFMLVKRETEKHQ